MPSDAIGPLSDSQFEVFTASDGEAAIRYTPSPADEPLLDSQFEVFTASDGEAAIRYTPSPADEPLLDSGSDSVRWYRLDGHTPVRMRTRAEQYIEWDARERGIRADADPYRVARTELNGDRYVSTVFLGLDHQYMSDHPPLLFETMVFPECHVCERCSTWDQALAQHDQVVAAERRNE